MLIGRASLHINIYIERWMFKIVEIRHNKMNVLLEMRHLWVVLC